MLKLTHDIIFIKKNLFKPILNVFGSLKAIVSMILAIHSTQLIDTKNQFLSQWISQILFDNNYQQEKLTQIARVMIMQA